jgi:hypothetical protein
MCRYCHKHQHKGGVYEATRSPTSAARHLEERKYLVGEAIAQKFAGEVAAVAIYNEDAVTRPRFALCEAVKDLLKPVQTNIVIRPSC